jgi:hypothetical protein
MAPGGSGGMSGGPSASTWTTSASLVPAADSVRAELPISGWSKNWLAYTRWDGVLVTVDDLGELTRAGRDGADIRRALFRYVEAGGTLLVLGPERAEPLGLAKADVLGHAATALAMASPGVGLDNLFRAAFAVAVAAEPVAEGRRRAVLAELPLTWQRFRDYRNGFVVCSPGFGRCLVSADRQSAYWSGERWGVVEEAWRGTLQPWESARSANTLNEEFPVIDDLGVPVKGLFVLMLAFTILIGPINLVLLTKQNRRMWMWWTVPSISLVTCLAVFGYMVVSEGWSGHSRVGAITVVDEVEKRSTTLGRAAYYSPLTPGDGLHYSAETEVSPHGNQHTALTSSCTLAWGQGQHLSRGWVSARVPAHFLLRKCVTQEERRITVRREGASLLVSNRLGADIRTLYLADEKGQLHHASDVPAGHEVALKRDPRRLKPSAAGWREIYRDAKWPPQAGWEKQLKNPEATLHPRTYLAEVDGSPFLEQGLDGAKVREQTSLVLGVMADLGP